MGKRKRKRRSNRITPRDYAKPASKVIVSQWIQEVVVLGIVISFIPDLMVGGIDNIYGYCPFTDNQCAEIEFTGAVKVGFGLLFTILTTLLVRHIIKVKAKSVNAGYGG